MKYTEVEIKFIRLMLDRAAMGNEVNTSAQMLVRSLRERKINADTFLGNGASSGPQEFDYGSILLSFGKYKGKTIGEVGEKDPSYLMWIVENVDRPLLVRQITEFLQKKYGL